MATPEFADDTLAAVRQLLREHLLEEVLGEDAAAYGSDDRSSRRELLDLLHALDGAVIAPNLALARAATLLSEAEQAEDGYLEGNADERWPDAPDDLWIDLHDPRSAEQERGLLAARAALESLRRELTGADLE